MQTKGEKMKQWFFILMIAVAITGCKKDGGDNPGGGNTGNNPIVDNPIGDGGDGGGGGQGGGTVNPNLIQFEFVDPETQLSLLAEVNLEAQTAEILSPPTNVTAVLRFQQVSGNMGMLRVEDESLAEACARQVRRLKQQQDRGRINENSFRVLGLHMGETYFELQPLFSDDTISALFSRIEELNLGVEFEYQGPAVSIGSVEHDYGSEDSLKIVYEQAYWDSFLKGLPWQNSFTVGGVLCDLISGASWMKATVETSRQEVTLPISLQN